MIKRLVLWAWLLAAGPASAQEIIELTGEDRGLEAGFEELYRLGTMSGEDWNSSETLPAWRSMARATSTSWTTSPTASSSWCRRLSHPGIGREGWRPGRIRERGSHDGDGRRAGGGGRPVGPRLPHPWSGRRIRADGPDGWASTVTRVGPIKAQPGADAIIGVPTQARWVMFTGAAFSGTLVLPSSHAIERTSLSGGRRRRIRSPKHGCPPSTSTICRRLTNGTWHRYPLSCCPR